MKELCLEQVESPIGTILLVSDGETLYALDFADYELRMRQGLQARYGVVGLQPTTASEFSDRLQAYLLGDFHCLKDIPVNPGGTGFQQQVWAALRTIPVGSTISYGALAATLGQPTASRAVGLANGRNPIAIVIPCHRVIGANSKLTGYAGGLERKRWLLHHEGVELNG